MIALLARHRYGIPIFILALVLFIKLAATPSLNRSVFNRFPPCD